MMKWPEREQYKTGEYRGGPLHAQALYDRSLEYAIRNSYGADHPPFEDYVCGLMCAPYLRKLFAPIADLYPRPLPGLEPGAGYWRPTP